MPIFSSMALRSIEGGPVRNVLPRTVKDVSHVVYLKTVPDLSVMV
jgi:hypothetical protein